MKRALIFLLLIVACKARETAQPNVLLITLDTFRADRGNAPTISAVAANGVRFENAISNVPLTLPSHATILSGMLPLHHGLRNNGAGSFPNDRATLATLLQAKGYRTAAFTGAFVLDHRFGLNRGFDVYDDEIPRDPTLGDHLEAERRGDAVVDRALGWLRQDDARPFFAWVHLYDAHFPYTPPEPYRTQFAKSPYDGEVAFVDAQVQRLIAFLDERKLRENTIIVIAGDHGEALGEHGELTHGLLLYEPTLRVPLVLSAPGIEHSVVKTPVSLADIAPTIAAFTNVQLGTVDGRDLSNALREKEEPPVADLYAETEYPAVYGWSPLAALRRANFKYIAAPGAELYDLARDPNETRNVLADERRVMRALDTELKTLRANATTPQIAQQPDAETMAKLASLGYVGGVPAPRTGANRPDPKAMVSFFRRFEEATWATTDKRYAEAAAILEDLVKGDPQNSVFRASLAKVERHLGRAQRAIELYREAVALTPDDAQAWYNLAAAFQEGGDLRRAGDAVTEALKRDGRNSDAHNVLGIIYSGEGRPQLALDEFQKALAIDPRNARIHNNIGNAARAMGRNDEADAAFRRAIELAPNYADPYNGLGALDIDRERYAQAVGNLDRALQLAPDFHEARLNRAVALQLGGNLPAAIDEYRAFIARSAKDPSFVQQRSAASAMLAKLQSAR